MWTISQGPRGSASATQDLGAGAAGAEAGVAGAAGAAPLKENLAAGLLALAGWNDTDETGKPVYETFLDPMCGSGTIVIEAAWMRANMAPGLNRRFSCERWLDADRALWTKLRAEARAQIRPMVP